MKLDDIMARPIKSVIIATFTEVTITKYELAIIIPICIMTSKNLTVQLSRRLQLPNPLETHTKVIKAAGPKLALMKVFHLYRPNDL